MNSPAKSSLLWNIVDPDDPYDIRKSMIARLPDHSANFMGHHLQIVCLMQAAQIERLSEYLDEFKIKYREVERKELDRHSYEILIKELTEKNNFLAGFKSENEKLKEFIKRQSIQMEEIQKNRSVNSGELLELQSKYENLLLQLRSCRDALSQTQNSELKLSTEYKELRIRFDNLEKKRLSDLTAEREKYELKIKERIEIEVRELKHKHESQIYQMESDIRLYKQQIESKNHEITILMSKNQILNKDILSLEKQINTSSGLLNKTRELQLLNKTLTEKTKELEGIFVQYQKLQENLRQAQKYMVEVERERDYYRSKMETHSEEKLIQLQNKVALLSSEVQRLTYLISQKNLQNSEFQKGLKEWAFKYESLQTKSNRQIYNLNEAVRSLELKVNLSDQVEEKITMLSTEIERLNAILKAKNDQIISLETKVNASQSTLTELSALRTSNIDKTNIINSLQREKSFLEDKLSGVKNEQLGELDSLRNANLQLKNELENERSKVRSINERITVLIREKQILQVQVSGNSGNLRQYEQRIRAYENSIPKMSQEIDRLNVVLKQREQYTLSIKNQLNEANLELQKMRAEIDGVRRDSISQSKVEIEIKRRVQIYEQKYLKLEEASKAMRENEANMKVNIRQLETRISFLQGENEKLVDQLKFKDRQMVELSSKTENKFYNQISQLNQTLIILRNENEKYREEKNKLRTSIDGLEKNMINKEREMGLYRTQYMREYEEKIQNLQRQNQRVRRENQELKLDLNSYSSKIMEVKKEVEDECMRIYRSQLQGKDEIISTLEKQFKMTKQELEGMKMNSRSTEDNLKNYKERLLMVSSEIERLTILLTRKQEENEQLKHQVQVAHHENKNSQEISQKVYHYSQQITQLNNQLQTHLLTLNQLKGEKEQLLKALQEKNKLVVELERRSSEKGKNDIELRNLRVMVEELEELVQHTRMQRDELFQLSHELQSQLKDRSVRVDEGKIYKEVEERLYLKQQKEIQQIENIYRMKIQEEVERTARLNENRIKKVEEENLQLRRSLDSINHQYEKLNLIAHEYKERLDGIHSLEVQINEYRTRSKSYNEEVTKLRRENGELVQKCRSYEMQLNQTAGQIERLTMMIRQKGNSEQFRKEIQNLRHSLRMKDEESEEWENKYTKLYYTYQEISSMHQRLKNQYELSRNKISQYQQKILKLEHQFENLNSYLHSMKLQIDSLKEENFKLKSDSSLEEKNRQLSIEIDRLTALNDALKLEVSDTRLRFSDQTALQKRIQEYMGLMVILFAEIESLRKRVEETERQYEHVRRSSLTPYRVDRSSVDRGKK